MQVTLKLQPGLPSLRTPALKGCVEQAIDAGHERFGMKLLQHTLEKDGLSLIVTAPNRRALSRGIQGISVRIARAVNRKLERKGRLFADRYDAHLLTSGSKPAGSKAAASRAGTQRAAARKAATAKPPARKPARSRSTTKATRAARPAIARRKAARSPAPRKPATRKAAASGSAASRSAATRSGERSASTRASRTAARA